MKKVAIMLSLTIPASGKTTTYNTFKQNKKHYYVNIISSDNIRHEKMMTLLAKSNNLTKSEAYQQTKQIANIQYYQQLSSILSCIQTTNQYNNFIIFMDKNYSQATLSPALDQIKQIIIKHPALCIRIVGIFPKCQKLLKISNQIHFPFSSSYVACCLKRVISRTTHPTLEGTKLYRASACIGWANCFRSFPVQTQKLYTYFDQIISLPYTKQQTIPQCIEQMIEKILEQTKLGSFDQHPLLIKLVQYIQSWEYQQLKSQQNLQLIQQIFQDLFVKIHPKN